MAVVLLIGSFGTAQAVGPREDEVPPLNCSGLDAVSLTASEAGSINARESKSGSDCSYSVTVMPPPADQSTNLDNSESSSCVVTTSPIVGTGDGLHLETLTVGQCDGVIILIDVTVGAKTSQGSLQASALTFETATATLKGHDAPGFTMFEHFAWLHWSYLTTPVTMITVDHGTDDNIWWGLVSEATGHGAEAGTEFYQNWHSAVWHSDGFPLPIGPPIGANTKATIHGGPLGAFQCSFSHYWTYGSGNYAGKHFSTSCTTP